MHVSITVRHVPGFTMSDSNQHIPRSILAFLLGVFLVAGVTACGSDATRVISQRPASASQTASDADSGRLPASDASGQAGVWYAIDATARSDNEVLGMLTLRLIRAQRSDGALRLRIAFEYDGEQGMSITSGLSSQSFRLTDNSGRSYALRAGDEAVIYIRPNGGWFRPGGGVAGDLTFPLPRGKPPYRLEVATYEPIPFTLDAPLPEPPLNALPAGDYEVGLALQSADDTLAPVRLHVNRIRVDEETVSFAVAFENTLRTGYDVIGPSGSRDAWLVDADRNQYVPLRTSAGLASSIDPPDGWEPGEFHEGEITFPMPETPGLLRFLFRSYPAATLRFDATGLVAATVTDVAGGPPPPTPTPKPEQAAYAEISRLLAQQAQAILNRDEAGYLAPFSPELQASQQTIFRRMTGVPFTSYRLEINPNEKLRGAERGTLSRLNIWGTYTLQDLPADNSFLYTSDQDFVRSGDGWQITAVSQKRPVPFWFLGDVVPDRSPHFLIFTRPNTQTSTAILADELETAYATLQARGLPLDPVNAAFFTGPDEDLYELTGRGGTQVLGMALAQYGYENGHIFVHSRAFFINGKAFADYSGERAAEERASTILHEMVHLALSKDSRPFIPPWLSEGLAVYFAEQAPPEALRTLVTEGRLDDLSLVELTAAQSLGEHDVLGERVGYEYLYSGATILYLVERFGEDQVMAFYRAYAQVPDEEIVQRLQGPMAEVVADAHMTQMAQEKTAQFVPQFFGMTLEELDAAVKAWLQNQF